MSRLFKAEQITLGSERKSIGMTNLASPDSESNVSEIACVPARPDNGAQLAELKRQLPELAHSHAEQTRAFEELERAAYQRGVDKGIETGIARAEYGHAQQLDALAAGIDSALAVFGERLLGIEAIALDVAQAALRKTLGDSDRYAALVVQTARHHVAQIAAGSLIGMRVSAEDFPTSAELSEAFAAITRNTKLAVEVDPQLTAGSCVIDLTLGRLDVSLPRQLAQIDHTLDGLRADD
ncbi:hypothetical protein BTH42_14935 [Burkholderia sp. SRS-W-2-2016]|uniref:FliH/SctL family protein n=1 Tax=Burkholderia sp. SRS-W-2-2016 TaxID=1926878 RepID=UPI00094ACC88|nr:hypothetical protein [Burkholderia sp. SRS-W-2-2016]OLL30867.1 hypothetical protein BTH42_14935 [Burkholderia sp. SRS-W-2-2016]